MTARLTMSWAARRDYRRLGAIPGLPPVTHPEVRHDAGIRVPADDGTALLTDHWWADGADGDTILVRTPYGRAGAAGIARLIAERGHHVVVQSCRGTFGSGGRFRPLHDEAADGQAALRWLKDQPWATGRVHSWGGSYFGVTQWAYCDGELQPDAMSIAVSARRFDDAVVYPGGGFAMDTPLTWAYGLGLQERGPASRLVGMVRARSAVARAALTVPPADAVREALGEDAEFFRDWIEHSDAGDPWWRPMRFASDLTKVPPVTLLAGWQDLFLVGQLDDYAVLLAAGVQVRLVVGNWVHGAPELAEIALRDTLHELDGPLITPAVRVEVSGGGGWHDLERWPPESVNLDLELTAARTLAEPGPPRELAVMSYRYDPAHPTPDAGGRTLNPFSAGRREQRGRESRDDVLVFTGDLLPEPLTVMGAPTISFTLSSTNPRADVFVRLCEVDAAGVSRTLTDAYLRLPAAAGDARRIELTLAPIAHRFVAGARVRLQVSSGAHPLHLRNPGTADPVRDHSRLIPSTQHLTLGGSSPAVLSLPVVG